MSLQWLLSSLVGMVLLVSSSSSSSEATPSPFVEGTKRLLAGDKPIVFKDLLRVRSLKSKNATASTYEIVDYPLKSKPALFEKALGLRKGRPFEFNIDKWRMLVGGGMYGNLSAHATTDNTGRAIVEISGYELPSITFTPEVSAGVSGFAPDVSGGIAYEDKNFLGLGQKLSVLVSKKEAENKLSDLVNVKGKQSGEIFPHVEIKWSDFCVGQSPKVAIKYEENLLCEHSSDLQPVGADDDNVIKTLGEKVNTRLSRLAVVFKETTFQNLPFQKWGAPLCKIEAALEPYHQTMRANMKTLLLSGTEIYSTITTPSGRVKLFCDQGHLFEQHMSEMYVQTALDYFSAPRTLGNWIPPLQKYSWMPKKIEFLGTFKSKIMKSFGPGRLPLYHFVNLGDTQVLRGQASESDTNRRVPSYAAVKGDLYINTGKSVNPGCFVDTVLYRDHGSAECKPHLAVGISLRAMGFRVDAGCPLNFASFSSVGQSLKQSPRIYLGMDQEL